MSDISDHITSSDFIVISCEHGGNRIPTHYRQLFQGHEAVLDTHRGYDAGALTLANEFADMLAAPLFISTTSRLVIDLNRSVGHPRLFSEFTRHVDHEIGARIVEHHYLPYRRDVESVIARAIGDGYRVIHLSIHSFTPELNGKVRNADIGLLYDSARLAESDICRRWQMMLKKHAPGLKARLNYPYSGKMDGFTSHLRRHFPEQCYFGIEVEVNQKHVARGGRHWRMVRQAVMDGFRDVLVLLSDEWTADFSQGGQQKVRYAVNKV